MNQQEVFDLAFVNQERARGVLVSSGIADVWERNGCRVNLVGSLRMGLLASHRDIDLHVYSKGITVEGSFAIAAQVARLPGVTEIRCINGLHTDEHCVAWHILPHPRIAVRPAFSKRSRYAHCHEYSKWASSLGS